MSEIIGSEWLQDFGNEPDQEFDYGAEFGYLLSPEACRRQGPDGCDP